ncbi:hypothetical protein ACFORH_39080 [Amycolatopsis roodepoortensis]|uniref:Acetoacetate decarboxylase n=1 Tax=Amycolatopsis roodepoortensis TaxID=700274 RepID=A0ABR9LIJ9_9PSEU|nr:hypothetical protein [Amycolatopsis roodepoortensis]MBE1580519.1 hypothetical protein [Amycolatopsis roodepoortensis]
MTYNDPEKGRVRDRIQVTGERYAKARRLLLQRPAPTADELAAADAVTFDPYAGLDSQSGALPVWAARSMGLVAGAGPDCFVLDVADSFGPAPGAAGKLAIAARGFTYRGLPAVVLECVEIVEGHGKIPGAWWHSFGIRLADAGWSYSAVGDGQTLDWLAEITPDPRSPSRPVRLRVTDPLGAVVFDGPLLVSPGWQARTRVHPVGLLVVAGPVSGARVPATFDDALVDETLGIGNLVAARLPVDFH